MDRIFRKKKKLKELLYRDVRESKKKGQPNKCKKKQKTKKQKSCLSAKRRVQGESYTPETSKANRRGNFIWVTDTEGTN